LPRGSICRNDPINNTDPLGLTVSETESCGGLPSGYTPYLISDAPVLSLAAWEHLAVGAANIISLVDNTFYGGLDLLGQAGEKADDASIYFTGMNSVELYMNTKAAGPIAVPGAIPYALSRLGTAARAAVAFLTRGGRAVSIEAEEFSQWWRVKRPLGSTAGHIDLSASTCERAAESSATIDRVRSVAQQGFDYAVDNPRVQGLNRMQLGKDAEVQATRWMRRWAERNDIPLGEAGLQFQVRGANSVPDVVFEPTKQILDFKLTPKAVRPAQSANFENDFPGYGVDYIFGP